VAIDGDERLLARLQLTAAGDQTARLLAWAALLGPERGSMTMITAMRSSS
jgi:hypothetical protein